MDGIVVNYDPKSQTGIVLSDGEMYPFRKADWRASLAPRRKDRVEFAVEGRLAKHIRFPQGREPADAALRRIAAGFDFGLMAGVYAVAFLVSASLVAILNVLLSMVEIDESEIGILIAASVILVLLTAAAWIWGTSYRGMRTVASGVAISATGVAVFILVKNALQGAS
jgi:hypothetical protein